MAKPDWSIHDIKSMLSARVPSGVLYHYTSLGNFIKIVQDKHMYASDIRYLNDAAELSHALSLFRLAQHRKNRAVEQISRAGGNMSTFLATVSPEFMLFLHQKVAAQCHVVCFSKNGNQLSQWRGYCPPHRGISIGFFAEDLRRAGQNQGFELEECRYSVRIQNDIARNMVDVIAAEGEAMSEQRRHEVMETVRSIAAILKHPRFREEKECRLVSQVRWHQSPPEVVHYREGKSMLIPFKHFRIPRDDGGRVKIARVIVGPTAHVRQSVRVVEEFLDSQNVAPSKPKVEYCDIPLREA